MRSTLYAVGLAASYVAVACCWIVFSSGAAAHVAVSVEQLGRFERLKGLWFVSLTGVGLFAGAFVLFRRLERYGKELVLRERVLLDNERRVFAGLMASSVAHDANNVLVGVLGDLEDIRSRPEHPAEACRRLETAVRRLVALNTRLLQVGRDTASHSSGPLELNAAVHEAVELVRRHPALRYARLAVAPSTPMWLQAHPMLIAQIVTNLLLNAGEATSGRGNIEVVLKREDDAAILEIRDDGPGVPEPDRAALFDALRSTKADGNGLGLFSVKACARAMGGSVEVLDGPAGGACFRVRLPLADLGRDSPARAACQTVEQT